MGKRPGSTRPALRPTLRPMPGARGGRSGWLGWLAAAIGIAAIAFVVGRAGLDVGVPFGSPLGSPAGTLPIRFGLSLDRSSGEVGVDASRFRSGDNVAWSVRLGAPIGASSVLVEVIRLDVTASVIVQAATPRPVDPNSTVIGFIDQASTMLSAWGPGTFEMHLYREAGGKLLAAGRFTLAETP
jgi:hypothetical protein